MEQRPKVGVGVCIIKDGKVLLGKRLNAHGDGSWSFPGGHLEFGESYEQCASREAEEEAGVKLKNLRFVTATNDIFPQEQKHYITVYMLGEYDSGEVIVKEPDKMVEWQWFSWEELPSPLFIPIQNLLKTGFHPVSFLAYSSKIYQHHKGKFYELLGTGRHSETLEELAIYKSLYDSPEFGKNAIWVRPLKMFQEEVEWQGKKVPRFKLLKD